MQERSNIRVSSSGYDSESHYSQELYEPEGQDLEECAFDIRNIGWTLGNNCPYHCLHCYSMSARRKGLNLSREIVDIVVRQLVHNGIGTVNLGGNEPVYTNGLSVNETLLPYIIRSLTDRGILVGLTTSGISAVILERFWPDEFRLLNDIDISFDSPLEDEHNTNRGANIYHHAIKAMRLCQEYHITHTVIMCAMEWNFDLPRLEKLILLAKQYDAHIRINPIKTVEPRHLRLKLTPEKYYDGFAYLMRHCDSLDLGEPPLAAITDTVSKQGCPCGRTSFRIHAITPDGKIPVSPCVYLHDYKVGNLIEDDLSDIIMSHKFRTFRKRNLNANKIPGCQYCELIDTCRGGCAARAYLDQIHQGGKRSLFCKDPYCPKEFIGVWDFPKEPSLCDATLVHQNYLCTWIGRPR